MRPTRRKRPPGSAPGQPVLTGEALPPRIHVIRYNAESIDEHDPADAAACLKLVGAGAVTWIDVQGLADLDLLRTLGDKLGLHPLALEDVVSLGQRPKIEDYDNHLFVIARMPEAGGTITTDQTSCFLRLDLLLTFQEHYGDCLDGVRERLRKGKGSMRRSGPDYLTYAILDAIVDGHFPVLETLGERLEDLESEVAA